jgi:hypothetical protein
MKVIIAILLLFTLGCPIHMPVFSGKLYQGDSANGGITRANPNEQVEFISATDPMFDKFTCTKTQDLINYLAEVQKALASCKRWGNE